MKIIKIIRQSRRDFTAIYICEHCNTESEGSGYDDRYFHNDVIPNMVCKKCGQKSPEEYRALSTKYKEGQQV